MVAVVGGNFQAIAQRGLATDDSQLAPQGPLVDLDDDAVDLVVELLAALLPPVAALDDRLDSGVVLGVGVYRKPRSASQATSSLWVARSTPGTAPIA